MKKRPLPLPLPELDYCITYCLTYHNPPILSTEVPKDHGACDALFVASYKAQIGGDVDYGFRGIHEDGTEMGPLHMFQVWMQLAAFLKDVLPAESGPKELCDAAYQTYVRAREMAEEENKKNRRKN